MSWADNPQWIAESPAGPLEITINLTKPEKDPRAIAEAASGTAGISGSKRGESAAAAARGGGGSDLPAAAAADSRWSDDGSGAHVPAGDECVLCWHRAPDGSLECAGAEGGLVREVTLAGEPWAWWFSPYGYFPEHLIVSSREHRPMAIDHDTITRLLDFCDAYPQFFIGSNADLPIVGGSLLAHDHFQGGGHRFPLMNAPVERAFAIEGLETVEAGIVRWPASVVRLRTADREALAAAACRVLDAWRPFTFAECGIEAFTLEEPSSVEAVAAHESMLQGTPAPSLAHEDEGSPGKSMVPHNTANPILWREGGDYVMDLVLRNNRTTPERPFGLFHPDESLFHIKKENIGLIEIMGRAILPARLAAELPAIKDECDRAYYEILKATGVFKQNEAGRRGWDAFTSTI